MVKKKETQQDVITIEKKTLLENFKLIIQEMKRYMDIPESSMKLIAIWIIGANQINDFDTYPYLFFNAMRGSGKTRILRFVMTACGGNVINSPTEAVIFRSNSPIGIDEFEGITRKGTENVRELLNSAYKKGIKVQRIRQVKTKKGTQYETEEFEVFRPIALANIWGMENVLGDRCITIRIDKSDNREITRKLEDFDRLKDIQCSLCSVVSMSEGYIHIKKGWNNYLEENQNYTNNIHITNNTNNTNNILKGKIPFNPTDFYKKIDKSGLAGRILELSFPLLYTAYSLNKKIFDELLETLKEIDEERKEEDMIENYDVSLMDFISQSTYRELFIKISTITQDFREFTSAGEEWINEKWIGRALKRLNLIKQKRRTSSGVECILNIEKAKKQIQIFK